MDKATLRIEVLVSQAKVIMRLEASLYNLNHGKEKKRVAAYEAPSDAQAVCSAKAYGNEHQSMATHGV